MTKSCADRVEIITIAGLSGGLHGRSYFTGGVRRYLGGDGLSAGGNFPYLAIVGPLRDIYVMAYFGLPRISFAR